MGAQLPAPLVGTLVDMLGRCLQRARQPLPADLLRLMMGPQPIGWVRAERAPLLQACWPELRADGQTLRWDAGAMSVQARSDRIGAVAQQLRERGAVPGWRNEPYVCEAPVDDPCERRGEVLFRLERSAFRVLGLMSRAVHVNGFLPDGSLLCGRRAMSKATDPGRLDNLAAGGLTADEDLMACARRELMEEAGVPLALSATLAAGGALRSTRMEAEGVHDEVLHVFNLALPMDFEPRNGDGEVSEFLRLDLPTLHQRLAQQEFSIDAAAVCAIGLLNPMDTGDPRK